MHRRLEELQLLKHSLLPDEILTFLIHPDDWQRALEDPPDAIHPNLLSDVSFSLGLSNTKRLWFQVLLPRSYPNVPAEIYVKGEALGREDQARWQNVVREKMCVVEGSESEYPTFQLMSEHLLPLLHEDLETSPASRLPPVGTLDPALSEANSLDTIYHALLTSHHLKSPQKRRSMQQWSSQLRVSGFAKVGYPGVIYCEGARLSIEEFVANVKAMQWLALRVRFMEPLAGDDSKGEHPEKRRWVELEKVGDVVEEMRRLGREAYVVEMGIGSVRTST